VELRRSTVQAGGTATGSLVELIERSNVRREQERRLGSGCLGTVGQAVKTSAVRPDSTTWPASRSGREVDAEGEQADGDAGGDRWPEVDEETGVVLADHQRPFGGRGLWADLEEARREVPSAESGLMRRAGCNGLPKVCLQHVFSATALNMIRLDAYWTGHNQHHTPSSRLERLAHRRTT